MHDVQDVVIMHPIYIGMIMSLIPSMGYTWLAIKFMLYANPSSIIDVAEIIVIIVIEIVCVLMWYNVYRSKQWLKTSAKQCIVKGRR